MNSFQPILHLQPNLFWEEEDNPGYLDTIRKYFDVQLIEHLHITDFPQHARLSLNLAKRAKFDYRFTNCMSWIPIFRSYILSPKYTFFQDMGYFKNYHSTFDYPLYLRPADGYKSFAGQVFPSKEKFVEEYTYLTKNLNFDDSLMCVSSPVKTIDKEWRTVWINNKFVDGCQYMDGQSFVEVSTDIPNQVVELASKIANTDYFINIPNFVIDICQSDGKLFLLEINSFESSSFYGCDLDKIYKTWSTAIQNSP
jgi:hypothetical protein